MTATTPDPDSGLTTTAHSATLAEYHAVTTTFPRDMSAKEIGRRYQATVDVQHEIANRWAAAHGLEITYVTETDPQDDGVVLLTTSWVVQIGRGAIEADPDHTDTCEPGALDRWRWSARVGHWRNLLQGLGREGRRLAVREDGMATVTNLNRRNHGFGIKVEDAAGRPDVRPLVTEGHLSGPPDSVTAADTTLDQATQSGYLPGTGPAEHRPSWLQNPAAAIHDGVGGDWSDT